MTIFFLGKKYVNYKYIEFFFENLIFVLSFFMYLYPVHALVQKSGFETTM